MSEPKDAPPSYDAVIGSQPSKSSHLEVPKGRNGISAPQRRSMEDEVRKLPPGWVRQYDDKSNHQFFVDTRANPPRSIWHHPYDDEQFLSTLSSEDRERMQAEELDIKKPYDHHMDTTDDEGDHATLPPRPNASVSHDQKSKGGIGRKLKDKITGSTHEEREVERAQREEEERQYYQLHLRYRAALQQASATGQPQFFAKGKDGKDIYVEPPGMAGAHNYAGGGYSNGTYGYNPYATGVYGNPNARFIRPADPYRRPYGGGYGGGLGMPLMGGMMGGMMLGGLMF